MIELHIKCRNEPNDRPDWEALGIEGKEETTEYRPLMIRHDLIDGFYPDTEGGCFVFYAGMELTVQESYEHLCSLY